MDWLDWAIVAASCVVSLGLGSYFTGKAARKGAEGYFAAERSLPWWAIGISNAATYQSGNGAFVMLVLTYGLVGNWWWWASWVIWMPLVALIWAVLWTRMRIVTTAELLTLRYGGRPAILARRVYAVMMFFFAVLIIAYVTGFFAKTIAPLVPMKEWQILLTFGAVTVVYTMLGGLQGSVFVAVVQFVIILVGCAAFLFVAVPQHGGWSQILGRINAVRPDALEQLPGSGKLGGLTLLMLVVQGFFFAGSPTAGEGMTAQRFMAARSERHAIGGQLFNAFISLSLRVLPLVGWGLLALACFWTPELADKRGEAPAGFRLIEDPAHAWGELIKTCSLPRGFVGLLVATEVAAFMSTLSALVNWGGSFVVNDFLKEIWPQMQRGTIVAVSRIVTVFLFVFAAVVTILYVKNMMSWFLFINSAMVVFLLPLAWFRFFWWRFNVWGELAATVLGLPLSILVWFGLGFEDKPFWQGTGLLFLSSFALLTVITLLTPPESPGTLLRFYERCHPPGFWKRQRAEAAPPPHGVRPLGHALVDSFLGIVACFGLVVGTNAVFTGSWGLLALGISCAGICGAWLLFRLRPKPVA